MRILHVTDVLSPVGGAQTSLHQTVGLMFAAGIEVAILHGDAGAPVPLGASVASFGDGGLGAWIRDFSPDVVHVHGLVVPEPVRGQVVGLPLVRSLHDFSGLCASGSKYFRNGCVCPRPHGRGCIVGATLRGCTHRLDPRPFATRYRTIARELPDLRERGVAVVHSRYMKDVASLNGLGDAAVEVVPLCVERADQAAIGSSTRTVAFAGRIVPEKGLDVLLRALAQCRDAWDELIVAGDGWDRPRCVRLAERLRISSRVRFLGRIASTDARDVLACARVVAVPSRWPEPFGLVGIEAMAVGRPVAASNVGGIPEWLDDGETGALVPPGDVGALAETLSRLLTDEERAAALGHEGWVRVQRFSPDDHIRRLLAVYERAARGSAAGVTVP